MSTFEDLQDDVIQAGGLLRVGMERLRDAVRAGKLGVHVRSRIERSLRQHGLVVLGGQLPSDQRATVWLIARNSDGGQLLLECLALIAEEAGSRANQDAA
jgi:hypothetical protein